MKSKTFTKCVKKKNEKRNKNNGKFQNNYYQLYNFYYANFFTSNKMDALKDF